MSILAKYSINKVEHSDIIELSNRAKIAKQKDNSVINATIGMLFDEKEKFYVFDCVKEAKKELSDQETFTYGNTVGTPIFLDGILDWVFQGYRKEFEEVMHAKVIATPGGTGAVANAFDNYLNEGESCLLPNHMWANYTQMTYEAHINYETYELFNENGGFNIESFRNKCLEHKAKQGRILALINDPCHNPTGYCMTSEEYDQLIAVINEISSDGTPFILLYDMAYIDYSYHGIKASRDNIHKFTQLGDNTLVILCFSGSKTLGLYGLRIGAMIGISKKKEHIDDFMNANQFSARSRYSMATTFGMNLIGKILCDQEYKEKFINELTSVSKMLINRSNIFIEEAKKVGLKTLPFVCGFFVTVKCEKDTMKVYDELVRNKVHVVPLSNGYLRVTIASVSSESCRILPHKIVEAIKKA